MPGGPTWGFASRSPVLRYGLLQLAQGRQPAYPPSAGSEALQLGHVLSRFALV